MNRREFVRLLAGVGVAAASGNLFRRELIPPGNLPTPVVTLTHPMMGTSVSISALDGDHLRGTMAIEAAFTEMERLENTLSRYRSDSAVSSLNLQGHLGQAPVEVLRVLERARFFSDISNGAFDVTIQPIVDLIARSFAANGDPPPQDEVVNDLHEVDYRGIEMVGSTVRLRKGMGVTLDGIAKGYIIDMAIDSLRRQGYEHALVEAGGDIRALGGKDQGRGWRIGIRDPLGRQDLIRVMDVTDRAVATSGDYEIFFDPDKKYYHIVNPKDGCCPQGIHSATVVASNAMDADAMGTAVMVLGPRLGLELVQRIAGTECFLVLHDGSTVESTGMKNFW
jgi:thiamine biosynthesis lipoprotein